jgi:hypothetical protein
VRHIAFFSVVAARLVISRHASQGISELWVFAIGEIVLVSMIEALHGAGTVSLSILPNTDVPVDDGQNCSSNRGRQHCYESGGIYWRIFCLEEEWSDEIAY